MIQGKPPKPLEYSDVPIGHEQLVVSTSAVGLASIPQNATKAIIVVEDKTIRWREDGTDPTSSVGTKSFLDTTIILDSRPRIDGFKAIRQGTSDAKLSVNYYERK